VYCVLTQFLQNVLKLSPLVSGLAFLPWSVMLFGVARIIPRLVARVDVKRIIAVGAAAITVAMFWLTHVSPASSYPVSILGPMLLFGAGAGLVFLPLNILILTGVRREESGAAAGVLQTMQQVGGSLGIAILVTVFGSASRDAATHVVARAHPQAQAVNVFAHGVASAFSVGTVFAVCILAVAVLAINAQASRRSAPLASE
jgi:MFS family permease